MGTKKIFVFESDLFEINEASGIYGFELRKKVPLHSQKGIGGIVYFYYKSPFEKHEKNWNA
jgi:hypothetical protein